MKSEAGRCGLRERRRNELLRALARANSARIALAEIALNSAHQGDAGAECEWRASYEIAQLLERALRIAVV